MSPTFTDVAKLAAHLTDDPEIETTVNALRQKSRLVFAMIQSRIQKNVSQKQMAAAIGCNPSKICRIESGYDEDLRWGDVIAWFQALGINISLLLDDDSLPRSTRIKHCVNRTHKMLAELVEIAKEMKEEPEITQKIHQFCGEVLLNFMTKFTDNYENLLSVIDVPPASLSIQNEDRSLERHEEPQTNELALSSV